MIRWMVVALLCASPALAQDPDDVEADAGAEVKLKVAKTADKVDARDHLPETVKITFTTTPAVSANVHWGRQLLCTTPCSVSRKRDSGPMDVVFRAGGYLPLHTRAFTFKDDKVRARMVPYGSESKLLGYKHPIEEPEGEGAEGEAPTPPPGAAPAPAPTPAAAPPGTPVIAPASP